MKQQEIVNEAIRIQRPLIQELRNIQHNLISIQQALGNIMDLTPIDMEVKLVRAMIREMFMDDRDIRQTMTGSVDETDWAAKTLANFQELMLKAEIQIRTLINNEKYLKFSQLAGTDKATTVALASVLKVELPVADPSNPKAIKPIPEPHRLSRDQEEKLADEILEFGIPQADKLTAKQIYLISADNEFNKREYQRMKRVVVEYGSKMKEKAPQIVQTQTPTAPKPKPKPKF